MPGNYPTIDDPLHIKTDSYDVPWGRASAILTVEKNLISLPTFSFYGGFGGGMHWVAPVVSDKFLFDTLLNKTLELDPSTDVELQQVFAVHGLVGLSFRMPLMPIKFSFEGKYTVMPQGSYEEPSQFFSIYFILSYVIGF